MCIVSVKGITCYLMNSFTLLAHKTNYIIKLILIGVKGPYFCLLHSNYEINKMCLDFDCNSH